MKQFKKKVKNILVEFSKNNVLVRKLFRHSLYLRRIFKYYFYYKTYNTDKQLVIFESYMGRSYACSPKALYEAMLNNKRYDNFRYVWAFKKPCEKMFMLDNKNTTIVRYGSKEYYQTYAKAKYWISNSRVPDHIKKRTDQIYIQTWHGTPLKKLGYDINIEGGNAMNSVKEIQNKYIIDAKRYSYMISPSKFCTEKFISAFNLKALDKENIIIEQGYPRNDFLFQYTQNDCLLIKNALKIPKSKKVILYAPTWRDNKHVTGIGYVYDLGIDFKRLQSALQDEYIILFRAHYFVANQFDFTEYEDFIIDVSNYDDINELYVISDILITDYSSVFFDFANLKRPIIFYMYDLDEYQNQLRDFYIDLQDLPGNIIIEEEDLIKEIKDILNTAYYSKKYIAFNNKYTYLDGENVSETILEKIIF